MSGRYLTAYPLDGYLHTRQTAKVALRRNRSSLRPLLESIGWVLAGAAVGSAAVMIGALGLLQLTEPRSPRSTATAMTFEIPALSQDR